jgi:hypothetical protein
MKQLQITKIEINELSICLCRNYRYNILLLDQYTSLLSCIYDKIKKHQCLCYYSTASTSYIYELCSEYGLQKELQWRKYANLMHVHKQKEYLKIIWIIFFNTPIAVAVRSEARMRVCVLVLSRVGSGLATCWSPVEAVLQTVCKLHSFQNNSETERGQSD